jgi:hypothetical protein
MSFSERPWHGRYADMGDTAERAFEARSKVGYVRMGISRPPLRVPDLHPYVRQIPDYLTTRGWIEVMGIGADQTLKLKVEKLAALKFWSLLMPVYLWVWDAHNKRHSEVPLALLEGLALDAEIARFPDSNAYYKIPAYELFIELPLTRSEA